MKRACGECTACCTTHRIPELNKPVGVRCQHVASTGCKIYAFRPHSCQEFECLWLQGHFHQDQRPDLLGLVFDVNQPPPGLKQALVVRETRPRASEEDAATALLNTLSQGVVIIVIAGDNRRLLGPPDQVRAYMNLSMRKVNR